MGLAAWSMPPMNFSMVIVEVNIAPGPLKNYKKKLRRRHRTTNFLPVLDDTRSFVNEDLVLNDTEQFIVFINNE